FHKTTILLFSFSLSIERRRPYLPSRNPNSSASLTLTRSIEGRKTNLETEPSRKIFPLEELHSATNMFNYDNKLGEGRFGIRRLKVWRNREDIDSATEVEIRKKVL
ncbi:hypothetical protein IGI04_015955, partial [Brassica rapa subsp. trilocularis]